jgi:ATP-dependent Lhr-like helicase
VGDTLRTVTPAAGGLGPTATERRAALAAALLERHGVVTRDAVMAEGIVGGFGAVYPVYREMEERGRVRRGYFVEGLGGAQFALVGAVDRLRALRRGTDPGPRSGAASAIVLAAADPANPYGAALPWPRAAERHDRSPGRASGAFVVLHDGDLALVLERGGRSLLSYSPFDDDAVAAACIEALRSLQVDGRVRRLQIERLDGLAVGASPHRERLVALGFRPSYRGLVL